MFSPFSKLELFKILFLMKDDFLKRRSSSTPSVGGKICSVRHRPHCTDPHVGRQWQALPDSVLLLPQPAELLPSAHRDPENESHIFTASCAS